MGLRGDFGKLGRLLASLERIAGGAVMKDLAKKLGEAAVQQIKREFEGERDPYGHPWKRLSPVTLKRSPRRAGGKVLQDTGRLRRSFGRTALETVPGGFAITTNVRYAAIHNFGGTIAARSPLGRYRHVHFNERGRFSTGAAAFRGMKVHTTIGEVIIPRRQILPARTTGGLGPIWRRAFTTEAQAVMRRTFGRGR